MPGDLHADHPRTKGLVQELAVARLVAEIGDDQRVALIMPVDRGERTRPRAAIKPLRQLVEVQDAEH